MKNGKLLRNLSADRRLRRCCRITRIVPDDNPAATNSAARSPTSLAAKKFTFIRVDERFGFSQRLFEGAVAFGHDRTDDLPAVPADGLVVRNAGDPPGDLDKRGDPPLTVAVESYLDAWPAAAIASLAKGRSLSAMTRYPAGLGWIPSSRLNAGSVATPSRKNGMKISSFSAARTG